MSDGTAGREIQLRENLEVGWMENGYPLTVMREGGVDPEEVGFLSIAALLWDLSWSVGAA